MAAKVPVYGITEFSHHEHESFFYANVLSAHLESHQFINTPHKHSTYITILFTKGKGKHQIDFDTYDIRPGSVFLLSPGQVHCWKLSRDADGFVFFHTKEFYDSIFLKRKIEDYPFFYLQQNYPVIYLSKTDTGNVKKIFMEIYQEYKQRIKGWEIKLETLTDLAYIELSRLYTNKTEKGKTTDQGFLKVKKLQKLIDEHFRNKKFPADYADLMNMSTRHLSRICSELVHKSTGDLITERILIEAKRLLIQKDITVAMVADELGYEDYSYFIRMFKKNTGLSPKEFQAGIHQPFD